MHVFPSFVAWTFSIATNISLVFFLFQRRLWHPQTQKPGNDRINTPPVKRSISANLADGLCGQKIVNLSRLPSTLPKVQTAWTTLLTVIRPISRCDSSQSKSSNDAFFGRVDEYESILSIADEGLGFLTKGNSELRWPLKSQEAAPYLKVSRGTLMALLCLTNGRPIFNYSDSVGHRSAYASYCGQWRIEWPIGDYARAYLYPHDSHSLSKDVYPATLPQRISACIRMLAGVVASPAPNGFKCGFSGRKEAGEYILQYTIKGFGGAHSGRHFYSIMGGNINEVDYLLMKVVKAKYQPSKDTISLSLPSKTGMQDVVLYIPPQEQTVLNEVLDYLPWTSLSWSIHRGMHDILVAFAKERMDRYRSDLANVLRQVVSTQSDSVCARGWDREFVETHMAEFAASTVLAGRGNSGDAIRVVIDIAAVLWNGDTSALDETIFWRHLSPEVSSQDMDPLTVAALVKFVVLEWSMHLDYQMYHDLPLDLYLG